MVDELVESNALHSEEAIAAFKAVDRGHFWPSQGGDLAYADMPLRYGRLHLSAPHIYGKALESLMPLRPGMSFLSVGSGTGYFNCIVSEFIGSAAANHGVEIWPETIGHARECSAQLGKTTIEYSLGNVYQLNVSETMRYDRIYIGACANSRSKYLYSLLEVGGILIGPFQMGHSQQLRRVIRQTECHFFVEVLGSVQFACLVEPPAELPVPNGQYAATETQSGAATPAIASSGDGTSADEFRNQLGLPGVPFTYCLLEAPWTPARSWLYPASFKQAVAIGLLCRPQGEGVVGLPVEIWIKHIIPWCSRRWFEAPAHLMMPSSMCMASQKVEDGEDGSDDFASTRAPSSRPSSVHTTPGSGPSQPPVDILMQEASDSTWDSENTLIEVWSNGQRHAIGAEGDPDDIPPETDSRMAEPLRVLQLLAEEAATRRQRRRRREEDEEDYRHHPLPILQTWETGQDDEQDDEAWQYGDEFEEMQMDIEPSGVGLQTELDSEMQDVEENELML
eukprot:TRINITY_DN47949_c0_g1_i1.p1 TRINITY_DN47949_c0_g1~~TRINITY_DN47949_c0_g1_i1.p1  ORF type:complete len:576 (-),score=88.45 TRINITY_DN47949_c0_g1_i1:91-1611(-)